MRCSTSRLFERRRLWTRVLALALMVATWRGPIPCLHVHGHDAESVPTSVARHVRGYHADESTAQTSGWHIHLMLPQDFWQLEECPSPKNDEPDDPLLAQRTVVQLVSDSASSLSTLLSTQALCISPVDGQSLIGPTPLVKLPARDFASPTIATSFIASLLSAAPLCAVTGVALC